MNRMACPNCGDLMGGPVIVSGVGGYPDAHWGCDSCGTKVVVPLPDSPSADAKAKVVRADG